MKINVIKELKTVTSVSYDLNLKDNKKQCETYLKPI